MPVSWNIPLIALSLFIAIAGSLTALSHAQRMRHSDGMTHQLWVQVGSITLGLTIWSMHFTGMLAFHVATPIGYDLAMTFLSAVPAITASYLGFRLLRRPQIQTKHIIQSSLLMGLGIVAMHYMGMASIKMSPPISYTPWSVVAASVIAVIASAGALLMMYRGDVVNLSTSPSFILGGVVMGLAISGMHYTAMLGVNVVPGSVCLSYGNGLGRNTPALLVTFISLLWFVGGIVAAFYDQRIARNNVAALLKLENAHLELQQRSEELAEQEELMRSISVAAQDAIIMINHEGMIQYWNPAAEKMFGYAHDEVIGLALHELVTPVRNLPSFNEGFHHFSTNGTGEFIGALRELTAVRRNGEEFQAEVSLSAVKVKQHWNAIGFVRDITERNEARAKLEQLATTDFLTGLYNRRYFNEHLSKEVFRAQRYHLPLTLILFDVDHFKKINDTHGHHVGDRVLIELAGAIKDCLRASDIVARWGGEEFAVLAPSSDLATGCLLAEKLRTKIMALELPEVGHFTCSFGVASYDLTRTEEDLVKEADRCLYKAKHAGRNRVEYV